MISRRLRHTVIDIDSICGIDERREGVPFSPGSKLPPKSYSQRFGIFNDSFRKKTIRKENDRKENSSVRKSACRHFPLNISKDAGTLIKTFKKVRKWHTFPFFKKNAACHIKASLTIEAAIAIPMLIFTMYMLMFPLKVMEAERRLQNSLEEISENLSLAEYVKRTGGELIDTEKIDIDEMGEIFSSIGQGTAMAAALNACDGRYLKNAAIMPETSILSEEEDSEDGRIYIKVTYSPEMPINLFNLMLSNKSLAVNRRAWIGSDGGRGRGEYGSNEELSADDRDRIVYLGKTSSEVYHLSSSCHYLSNVLKTADASKMDELRNSSGGKYYPCKSCKPKESGIVYYLESGTAYHDSQDCKAITAYVHTEKLGDCLDRGMRPCSYCGG